MIPVHWIPILAIVGAAFLLGQATAQEQGGMSTPPWMKQTDEHKRLAASVGEFDVAGELWLAPGGQPMPYQATAKRELVLGGNYLKETLHGTWQGQPFVGWLFSGYDTVRKRHFNIWMDNASPVPSIALGGEKEGQLDFVGEEPHPFTGKLTKSASTVETNEEGHTVVSMFWVQPDGTRQIHMRLTYRPRKSE